MPLAVLNDEEVRQLLEGLTRDELDSVREELSSALNEYSTATQIAPPGVEVADLDDHEHDSIHQPPRTSVRSSRTGTTTLFMPSSGPSGLGIKVITLSSPSSGNGAGTRNSTSSAAAEAATAHDGGHSRRQSASRGTLSSSSPQRHGSRTGSPATPTQRGASSTVGHEQLTLPYVAPTGALALFTPQGLPMAFVHARTLTAFRTALASSCLVIRRGHVRTITVFGAGLQAYWHVRLALKLRGREIRAVNFINHRFSDSAKSILKRLNAVPAEIKAREGWATGSPKGASGKGGGETHGVGCQFSVLTPGYSDYERLVREQLLAADVIFCCTPGKRTPTASPPSGARESPPLPGDEDNVHAAPDVGALFDPSILTSHEGRRKGRLIVAIGSYTPDTRELPLELLRQATRHEPGHWHFHRHAPEGGVVIVDTLDGAMKEAGEIIQAGLEPRQLVEYVIHSYLLSTARAEV